MQDVRAPFFRLRESCFHDGDGDPFDFDVHLEGGDAVFVACDFEVHVAERIFCAEDVGEDRDIRLLRE